MPKHPRRRTLLVIDDEPSILYAFREVFHEPDVSLLTAASAGEGLEHVRRGRADVLILDLNLPDVSGLEAFRQIQQIDGKLPVIFITAHGKTETAIEAMKLGAFDYLLKPLDLDELCALVERAFEVSRLMRVPAVVAEEDVPADDSADVLVGRCPAMQNVYKAIGRVAQQDVTVLILGESGTGKELVARAIYNHSHRSAGPFIAINCAAIPETLLESELFGHEKGAFTGADRRRVGKFEQCSGGTLFLDEIGDMSPLTQSKVLRVLQEQRFERLGGNETVATNVRIIAATNRNLEQLVAEGEFRGDLFYRLGVFTIHLPPLRERGEDLPLLVSHFVRRFSRELGKDIQEVPAETLALLQRHDWPGNLRELQSVLKQSMLEASGRFLLPDFLPQVLRHVKAMEAPAARAEGEQAISATGRQPPSPQSCPPADAEAFLRQRLTSGSENLYQEWISLMERYLITCVLQHTGGNQAHAARLLGIDRATLRSKLRSLGIVIERAIS
jgi:two-component system nitrogen regulation response regulator GlnG